MRGFALIAAWAALGASLPVAAHSDAPDAARWGWLVERIATQIYPRPGSDAVSEAALAALAPDDAEAKAAFARCAEGVVAKAADKALRAAFAAQFACREQAGPVDWGRAANALLHKFSPHAAYYPATEFAEMAAASEADVAAKAPEAVMLDGVLVLTISQFDGETAFRAERLLSRQDPGAWRATIIDVRGNKGGLLDAVVAVADMFTDGKVPLFTTRGQQTWDIERYFSRPGDVSRGRPLAILIDGESENGAEILARALQQRGQATIMGAASAGQVVIRTILPLPGGAAVIMPTSGVEGGDGRPLTGPVQPDTILVSAPDQWLADAAALLIGAQAKGAGGR